MRDGVYVTKDETARIWELLKTVPARVVLVGIPEDKAARKELGPMTNAVLGYIHERGAPEANIPARPFLLPGIQSASDRIASKMRKMGVAALAGDSAGVEVALGEAGMIGRNAVLRKLVAGPFVPLAASTLRARARRGGLGKGLAVSRGATYELWNRARGEAPSTEFAKPLIDTGAMRQSVTYVIRDGRRAKI